MAKTVKKFCSIPNYLERSDKELFDVMSNLCLIRNLMPRHGSGLTFLHPQGKLRSEILAKAYGNEPEGAVNDLQSCVILDYLEKPSDFEPNFKNFLHREVGAKAAGNKITLDGGGEVTACAEFKMLSRRDEKPSNVNVWMLDGKYGAESGKRIEYTRNSADNEEKEGGGRRRARHSGGSDNDSLLQAVTCALLAKHCSDPDSAPHAAALANLLAFLKEKGHNDVRDAMNSLVSYDPVASWYIVTEPYASSPGGVVGSSLFGDFVAWMRDASRARLPMDKVRQYGEFVASHTSSASEVKECAAKQMEALEMSALPTGIAKLRGLVSEKNLARAELRILSIVLRNKLTNPADRAAVLPEYVDTFHHCATLDKPYLLVEKASCDVTFFYSIVKALLALDLLHNLRGPESAAAFKAQWNINGAPVVNNALLNSSDSLKAQLEASLSVSGGVDGV